MRILVFQHIASEHPGSFRDVMQAYGHTWDAVELDEGDEIPRLDDYDALLVMGGPMDVWEEDAHPWLVAEKAAIRDWVDGRRPYLGMCLGHQLLAASCDGEARLMTAPPEVGISNVSLSTDPIFEGVGEVCTCFQWHGAEVTKLPPGARIIATSPGCAIQAQAIGNFAYGLQFHMELTHTTAAEWGEIPEYRAALEKVKGPGALPGIQAGVAQNFPALHSAAVTIFSNFLGLAERAISEAKAA